MKLTFYKYQGTGNDFVIIDDREGIFDVSNTALVKFLCDRRFGIGADGLMLLQLTPGADFFMKYYNSDGNESSMCGNGGRCLCAFAEKVGLVSNKIHFTAVDGPHDAVLGKENDTLVVKLKMADVPEVEIGENYVFLNTGSPHYVEFVDNVQEMDVYARGKAIRYNDRFKEKGTNVNFVQKIDGGLFVRTYERGVEDETLSCGTGVTASVLAAYVKGIIKDDSCKVKTPGGDLAVYFDHNNNNSFKNVWLEGPAEFVFKGEIDV